jgi:dimethylaniline monooxygenase (N-oxide forming)
MKRVVIVGAGPCGLAALKEMREAGHEAILFEKSSSLGGAFATSAIYPNLHLTISNWAMAFSDFPDPTRLRYSTGEDYLHYLHMYTKHFGLERFIKYGTEVVSARLDAGTWNIETRQKAVPEDVSPLVQADALIVATGANQVPKDTPSSLAAFSGRILHSSQYDESFKREVAEKKLRVLVVGGGESGSDVSAELGDLSPNVTLWLRRAVCVGPRYLTKANEMAQIEANKSQDFPANGFLEAVTTNRMSAAQNVYAYGIWRRMLWHTPILNTGLRQMCLESTKEDWVMNDQATYVTKNQRLCEAINDMHIDVLVSPGVSAQGQTCEFTLESGRKVQRDFDAIVICTGYRADFEWLKVKGLSWEPRSWFLHCFPKGLGHCLFFVGYARPHQGGIPAVAEMLSRYIALLLLGRQVLPVNYADQAQRDSQAAREYYHITPNLNSLVDYNAIMESVARRIGCEPRLPVACVVLVQLNLLATAAMAGQCIWGQEIGRLLPMVAVWLASVAGFFLYDDGLLIKWWFYPQWSVWYRQRGPGARPEYISHVLDRVRLLRSTKINAGFVLLVGWSIPTYYLQQLLNLVLFVAHVILETLGLSFPKAWGGLWRPKLFVLHSNPWRISDLIMP